MARKLPIARGTAFGYFRASASLPMRNQTQMLVVTAVAEAGNGAPEKKPIARSPRLPTSTRPKAAKETNSRVSDLTESQQEIVEEAKAIARSPKFTSLRPAIKGKRHQIPPDDDIEGMIHQDADPDSGFSVFLKKRTKTIYFIRHAEGTHNQAAREAGTDNVLIGDMKFWDAPLNTTGVDQALDFRHDVISKDLSQVDMVVVSPLTRTLQTAMFCMGPLHGMPSPVQRPDGRMPPFIALEMCRERWGKYTCDGRRSISEISKDFPAVDFSLIEDDKDVFWGETREPDEDCAARAIRFLEWLSQRPESSIAVVTHSSFLRHMFIHNWEVLGRATQDQDELTRTAGNCELRTVVLCSHK